MPITIALVNDYEIVLSGLAAMLQAFPEIVVSEIDVGMNPANPVDIALLSTFGEGKQLREHASSLLSQPMIRKVALYTWDFERDVMEHALDIGVSGYLSKTLSAPALVDALQRIHRGEQLVSHPPHESEQYAGAEVIWPGKDAGLSEREGEILALIARGYSNAEICESLFLSLNSVKTHVRHIYEKIEVNSRSRAVLWALENGFRLRTDRIDLTNNSRDV